MKLLLFFAFISSAYASTYEEVFPQYYEYCAGTRLKYQKEHFDGSEGGIGGHAFVYLHGICKDYSKNYPQIKICDKEDDHQGVGISLDSDYSNVTWVAVPGRELMLFGNEDRDSQITQSNINNIIQKSYDLQIFKGVKFNSIADNLPKEEYEKKSAYFSIGTNLAVNWARELRCVKIPVQQEKLNSTVQFLNNLNDSYYKIGKEYKWSMMSNNCTHLSINIGSHLGIGKPIKTDQKILSQLGNIAIPANQYLKLMDKVVLNKKVKNNLNYSANQFGAIAKKYPAYESNEFFVTENLKALTLRPRKNLIKMFSSSKSYDKFLNNKKYTSLKENALYWNELYEKTQKKKRLSDERINQQLDLINSVLIND